MCVVGSKQHSLQMRLHVLLPCYVSRLLHNALARCVWGGWARLWVVVCMCGIHVVCTVFVCNISLCVDDVDLVLNLNTPPPQSLQDAGKGQSEDQDNILMAWFRMTPASSKTTEASKKTSRPVKVCRVTQPGVCVGCWTPCLHLCTPGTPTQAHPCEQQQVQAKQQ